MKVGLGMKFDVFWARGGGGGILPYMSYKGMCRCEGYGFQAVYSKIGYTPISIKVASGKNDA